MKTLLCAAVLIAAPALMLIPSGVGAEENSMAGEAVASVSAEKRIEQYRAAHSVWMGKVRAASEADRPDLMKERPKSAEVVSELWPSIDAHPGTDDTLQALVFIVTEVEKRQIRYRALSLLVDQFKESEKLTEVCAQLGGVPDRRVLGILETLMEENPHKEVQGNACFAYASWLKRYRAEKGADQIEECFNRIDAEFADVAHPYKGTLGKAAAGELFEIRNLKIGMPAPEIEAADMDGVPFKLSDYRGKVVFLDYWAHW